jgi:hypothetical protein
MNNPVDFGERQVQARWDFGERASDSKGCFRSNVTLLLLRGGLARGAGRLPDFFDRPTELAK